MKEITLPVLRKDVENLRKKIFMYETLQAEKEVKQKKVKGPFKSGKEILKRVK